jgi:hypothetical protein
MVCLRETFSCSVRMETGSLQKCERSTSRRLSGEKAESSTKTFSNVVVW